MDRFETPVGKQLQFQLVVSAEVLKLWGKGEWCQIPATVQLLKTLERRQAETEKGFLDLSETTYHWAHDLMVRVSRSRFPHALTLSAFYRETWFSGAAANLCVAWFNRVFYSPHAYFRR